ncbi:MAG: dTDP-4-dehydrorhamnose 3,5-epimerase family protein, partial [Pedobacter sp.]|nr:dTDP-4-dehydrorhamnose 3,5-epimerase family protein [Chitinophagaceae bacterium]
MNVEETKLKDCFIIHDTVFNDDRGYFFESFNKQRFAALTGISPDFV